MIQDVWAIEYDDARSFMLKQGFYEITYGDFFGLGCHVRITPLSAKTIGAISLPRTEIKISGNADAAKRFYDKFKMHFIKGGA